MSSSPHVPTESSTALASSHDVVRGLRTAKSLFLLAAGLSFLLSVTLWFSGDRERGLFVGLWVPSILSAGSLLLGGGHSRE